MGYVFLTNIVFSLNDSLSLIANWLFTSSITLPCFPMSFDRLHNGVLLHRCLEFFLAFLGCLYSLIRYDSTIASLGNMSFSMFLRSVYQLTSCFFFHSLSFVKRKALLELAALFSCHQVSKGLRK